MSEVQWIKITTDIFDDEKIQLIESMPEGDTLIVIFLTMLGKCYLRNSLLLWYLMKLHLKT